MRNSHSSESGILPVELTCEYLKDPQGIDVLRPRLSWQLTTDGSQDVRQTAYRILVADSPEALAENKGTLWDSGAVESDQSVLVAYAGATLASRTRCYWKICSTLSDGSTSDWSETANWSMGLLDQGDWSAKWISIDRGDRELDSKDSPMLRNVFDVPKAVVAAQVSICGLGYYEMFLNGQKVGDHVLDPTWTTFHRSAHYVTYELGAELQQGGNTLGVQLANGVYNQEFPDAWNFERAPWRAFPQMLLQLDIVYEDGSTACVTSDETWKASTGPVTWDQLRMGVMYDARKEQPGWSTPAFDDSAWTPAMLREGITGRLSAQMCEPIRVMKTLEAKAIREEEGAYVFDFGQNIAGWTRLTVTGEAGAEITMDHGTHGLVEGDPLQTNVYTLKGSGEETWEPRFTYHGFSTVRVSGLPCKPDKNTVDARVVYSSFDERGSFECSNPLLNKIVEMSRWSYMANFVGIPTDCPHREKNGWTADAHIATELGLSYFGSEAAYARWMLDYEAAQAEDGKLPCIIPSGGWGMDFLDGPAWESAYLLIPWYIYEYRGDRRVLERHYENYKLWLSWYRDMNRVSDKARFEGGGSPDSRYANPQKVNQDNIITYGIGDWPPNDKTPFEITSTAYYYESARIAAEVARLLGKDGDAAEYAELAQTIKTAFIRQFYEEETGMVGSGSQTALSCALFFGLVEVDDRQRVVENLVKTVVEAAYHPEVGCLGSKYLLRVLADNGHIDTAYKVMSNPECPGWGYLAASGRTTLAEGLDGRGSDNHVFLGDIAAFMMQYFAGIRHAPESPGFQRFLIKPQVAGDLSWVKAHHDSPYGRIVSNWAIEGDVFILDVTIPANTTAVVHLPGEADPMELGSGSHRLSTTLSESIP